MRVIDSHQHIWRIGGPGQSWPKPESPLIYRDFDMLDLRAAASQLEVGGTVLVQSQPDDRDTDWLLDQAADDPLVVAVVAWLDLAAPNASRRLTELSARPKMRGVRPMLQSIEPVDWILRDDVGAGLRTLVDLGIRFDALIRPAHLPALDRLAERWPDLPIVIDHAGKPSLSTGEIETWHRDMEAIARRPNVWCKLSGIRTEQASGQVAGALGPHMRQLVNWFGPRLMWGSDWPVLLESGDSYADWFATADRLTALPGPAREDLFAGAALRFYGIDEDRYAGMATPRAPHVRS